MEMKIVLSWKANTPYSLVELYRRPTGSCYFHRDCHHHHHHHIFFSWRDSPPSVPWPPPHSRGFLWFLDHAQRHTTVGWTPLDE